MGLNLAEPENKAPEIRALVDPRRAEKVGVWLGELTKAFLSWCLSCSFSAAGPLPGPHCGVPTVTASFRIFLISGS